MGKSSKESDTQDDAVPGDVAPPPKRSKKGKRKAEDVTEKQKKKEVGKSSSEDGSSSEDSYDDMEDAELDAQRPKSPTGCKVIYVTNLPEEAKFADVREFFKDIGTVVDVAWGVHSDFSYRNLGLVQFSTAEEAKKAVDLSGRLWMGRELIIGLNIGTNFLPSRRTWKPLHKEQESTGGQG